MAVSETQNLALRGMSDSKYGQLRHLVMRVCANHKRISIGNLVRGAVTDKKSRR